MRQNDDPRQFDPSVMSLAEAWRKALESSAVFLRDVGNGLLEASHNSLALLGLAVVAVLVFVAGTDQARHGAQSWALGWLQERIEQRAGVEGNLLPLGARRRAAPGGSDVLEPRQLSRDQAAVAEWLSKRHRVAAEPMARIVHEAWAIGPLGDVEPTLILAVAAVESAFNPFAQRSMGAQGLMQVVTREHAEKFDPFGGPLTAFDPVTSLWVGAQVLRDCSADGAGLEEALRCFVGAAGSSARDSGYIGRVLAEHRSMRQVAQAALGAAPR